MLVSQDWKLENRNWKIEMRKWKTEARKSKLDHRAGEVRNQQFQKVLARLLEEPRRGCFLAFDSRLSTAFEKQTAPGRLDDPSAVPRLRVGKRLPGS
jgi:hypothetical protein